MRRGLGLAFGTGLFIFVGRHQVVIPSEARDLGVYLQRLLLWRRPEPTSSAWLGM